jgi:hypothetical protein
MKSFWWFEENAIAGMARPGFNCTQWFELSFEEAVLVGWLGQFSSGSTSLAAFQNHVSTYGTKILRFYPLSEDEKSKALQVFEDRSNLKKILSRLAQRSQLLQEYDVSESHIHFQFNKARLDQEIEYLKGQGINRIISLTEAHHDKEALGAHFDTHHFSIGDLEPPRLEQVQQLSELIRAAKKNHEKIAVHCLAGIGRTSTMIIGAHLLMGEKLEPLKAQVARQNPTFVFAGKQAEFLQGLVSTLS